MKYIYPALFSPESDGGYSVSFPDIEGCFTCGDTLQDSIEMAQDALNLMLVELEDSHLPIQSPSSINNIKIKNDEFLTLIQADTMKYRKVLNNASVKKTLSIPSWLNDAAIASGINFSQVLQDALKTQLHL